VKRIALATNGAGYQIDKCLNFDFFKKSIALIVSDRTCEALEVAKKHQVDHVVLKEKDSLDLNDKILELAINREIDYLISPGFTRVFRGQLLEHYKKKIFNCHPSILPGFRGYYDTRDTQRKYHARKIFEREIDFGSRVIGNTIHVVTESIDEGHPVIVSTMNVAYEEGMSLTRHRLFVQECKCLLQLVSWLNQDRLKYDYDECPLIEGAKFEAPYFSPNLEDAEIINFSLSFPYRVEATPESV
jgi:phosphoribosylglycinamide formyltransferase-1